MYECCSVQILVLCSHKLCASVKRLLYFCFVLRFGNEDARCWTLCLASFTDFSATLHIDVGDIFLFTKDGQVAEHIDR